MYFRQIWEKFPQQVQMQLSSTNIFHNFLLHFWSLHKILHNLIKNITFIASLFRTLLTPRDVVFSMAESSCFITPYRTQRVNGSQTLRKPAQQHFYPSFLSISDKLGWRKSLLVRSEILGLFFNTLTAYHMYFGQNWQKLTKQVQMQSPSKQLTLSKISIVFFKSAYILWILKKGYLYSVIISAVINSKVCGSLNAQKLLIQSTLWQSTC